MKRLKSGISACKNIYATVFVFLLPLTLFATNPSETTFMEQEANAATISQDHLVVLWTSADPEVAKSMVFMYTLNAKKNGWWKEIIFIIWGPSARLACDNKEIAESLIRMKQTGIELLACKACADSYGCSPDLEKLGVTVKYMGVPLTDYIKEGIKVLTF